MYPVRHLRGKVPAGPHQIHGTGAGAGTARPCDLKLRCAGDRRRRCWHRRGGRAADLGLDTILIEAAKHYGGGTYFAHGASFPGSKTYYKKIGKESGLEEQVQFWLRMQKNGYKNMDKLRSNIAANGEFIDWFDALDPTFTAPFKPGAPGSPVAFDLTERHVNGKSNDDSIGPG